MAVYKKEFTLKLALRFSRPFFYAVILCLLSSLAGIVFAESSISIVDPETYVVRPGDRFHVDFWDGSTLPIDMAVTPEGLLLLPSIGSLNVGNLTLTEAKAGLNKLIGRFYSETDFTVSLVGVRPAKVMIIGGVDKPGLYIGTAYDRVSEMIDKAEGFVDGASRRRIKLYGYGAEHNVDLLRFERTGDLKANPNIYAGDKISVPLVKDSSTFVHVSGEVILPCSFEYIEGDNLGSVIDLSMGLTGLQSDSVYIFRKLSGDNRPIVKSISDLKYQVEPGDKIIIGRRAGENIDDYFSIVGEIKEPGKYPYHNGLNLQQAVQNAGGFTKQSDIFSLAMFRKIKSMRAPINIEPLPETTPNNLALDGSLEPVSLDIDRSFDKHLDKIVIQPGDSIIIPARTGLVGVYGMVNRPGTVALQRFAKASDLISEAGGFSHGADKGVITVIRKSSGMKINSSPAIDVFDGDMIIIDNDKNRKSLLEKIRDISLILGGASLVYLAVDNMTD
jgi:protein involved in polysaccharide export with SLBB domain